MPNTTQMFLKKARTISLKTEEYAAVRNNVSGFMQGQSVRNDGRVRLMDAMHPTHTFADARKIVLTTSEKELTRHELRSFMNMNPATQADDANWLIADVWQGVNIFQYVKPFFLSSLS